MNRVRSDCSEPDLQVKCFTSLNCKDSSVWITEPMDTNHKDNINVALMILQGICKFGFKARQRTRKFSDRVKQSIRFKRFWLYNLYFYSLSQSLLALYICMSIFFTFHWKWKHRFLIYLTDKCPWQHQNQKQKQTASIPHVGLMKKKITIPFFNKSNQWLVFLRGVGSKKWSTGFSCLSLVKCNATKELTSQRVFCGAT